MKPDASVVLQNDERRLNALPDVTLLPIRRLAVDDTAPQLHRSRRALHDRVYALLRHGLMIGAFMPGQVVTLRKLADSLGTSLMPVRAAIAQLVTLHVLELLPNGSVAVPKLTRARFVEITMIRRVLEGIAAEQAGARTTPQLVARLTRINQELLEAIRAHEILGCLSKNQEFHFTLYSVCPSEILVPFIETLWLQAGPMTYLSLAAPDTEWDASLHQSILAALAKGDAATVKSLVEEDILATSNHLLNCSVFRSEDEPASPSPSPLRLIPRKEGRRTTGASS